MYSIGDIVDKLIIENIKIYELRNKIHSKGISDEDYVEFSNKMNTLNKNRSVIMTFLDQKISGVVNLGESNSVLNIVKTYDHKKEGNKKRKKNKNR